MQIKKSLLVAGAVATIGVATAAAGVSAATSSTGGSGDSNSSIVDKIATKFNLNKDDVQKVFDEDRSAHEAEHEAKSEEKLTQAVKDGKITEDQKIKIIAKLAEMKSGMETMKNSMKDKTSEERKTLMEQKHTDLEAWAKENNIPMEYLMVMHFKGGGPGPGGPGGEFHVRFDDGAGTPKTDVQTN